MQSKFCGCTWTHNADGRTGIIAVKFIPFETYLLETSTHTNIAVTCRAGLIINAGIYQCVYVHICVYANARVNTVFMFWGRERPLLYIMYGHRVYFAPHTGLTLSHLQRTTRPRHITTLLTSCCS